MTVRLSPHNVSRILSDYFHGVSQATIAGRSGVDQSTVSLYASRFKRLASQIGILGAGKEFGMFNEVDALRSLSVELAKTKLTVEEAREGHRIMQLFLDMGVPPGRHADLVGLCRKIGEPVFIKASLELVKIEKETGTDYEEMVRKARRLALELHSMDKKLKGMQTDMASTDRILAERKRESSEIEKKLARLRRDAEAEQETLGNRLTIRKRKLKIDEQQLAEFTSMKADLAKSGITLSTLAKLAKEFTNGGTKG